MEITIYCLLKFMKFKDFSYCQQVDGVSGWLCPVCCLPGSAQT